jgi:hypothetical protein
VVNHNKKQRSQQVYIQATKVLADTKVEQEPYASSAKRWNHVSTILAASWMLSLVALSISTAGLSATGSKEITGFKARFRTHYVPRGTMKLKRKEFADLKQGGMTVNE